MFQFAKSIAGSSNFSLRREKAPTLSDAGASNRCQLNACAGHGIRSAWGKPRPANPKLLPFPGSFSKLAVAAAAICDKLMACMKRCYQPEG